MIAWGAALLGATGLLVLAWRKSRRRRTHTERLEAAAARYFREGGTQ